MKQKIKQISDFLGQKPWITGDSVRLIHVPVELALFSGYHSQPILQKKNLHGSQAIIGAYCLLFQITFVDFMLYEILDCHRLFEPGVLDDYANLKV